MLVNEVVNTKAIALAATENASNTIPILVYSGFQRRKSQVLI